MKHTIYTGLSRANRAGWSVLNSVKKRILANIIIEINVATPTEIRAFFNVLKRRRLASRELIQNRSTPAKTISHAERAAEEFNIMKRILQKAIEFVTISIP